MATLKFDKNELVNLEYSLGREFLSTNRAGGYMSSTIICCNTRKYHGLMVCPVKEYNDENYVLLSTIDETVIQHEQSFNLAIHKFPNSYDPKGHKYITNFDYTPTPSITYRVGGVEIKKELLWLHTHEQLLIRYTLLNATSPTKLRLRPFLAYRQIHTLSKANMFANSHFYPIDGGIKIRMYSDMPWLHMQLNTDNEFIPAPDWYYDFEYPEEAARGYESHEDLLTPGIFEMDIQKGQSIILSCSTNEIKSANLAKEFKEEISKRTDKTEFIPCLKHSARQFVINKENKKIVLAGYPWLNNRGRDTFIALPGITLTQGNVKDCTDVLKNMVANMRNGIFPNYENNCNSADTSLWFFHTLQQLEKHTSKENIWTLFGEAMKNVISAYANGLPEQGIFMHDNGLIWASKEKTALTWMDAYIDGYPVTPRDGYQVEVNALWFNAISYTLDMAKRYKDKKFVAEWEGFPERIKESFINTFWIPSDNYLADYVNEYGQNKQIRPNQIIACALKYRILDELQIKGVLDIVEQHLLTPKGLRTLSPTDPAYQGKYEGDENTRNRAYHQGTVWPWLLAYYMKANLNLYGTQYILTAHDILTSIEENFLEYGVGSVAEVFDGNPPYHPKGAISFAMSVGAVLGMTEILQKKLKNIKKA